MKKNELISVVIPIYNVEKYLENCINSVLNQTYSNIEVILVDDGSPDNCGKICDLYAKKDSRIKVIHKENGGLSDARNCGLLNSTGKYVTFIDSDDDVTLDYVEYLYNLIKKYNTKMSICSFNIVTPNKIIDNGKNYSEELLNTEDCLDRLLCSKGFNVSAWAKMYDLKLFDKISFPKGEICEDNGTTYKLIMECKNVAYGNESKYNYYMRDSSIMTSSFNINRLALINFTDEMAKSVLKKYPKLSETVEKRQIESRFSILRQIIVLKTNDFKDLEKEIITYLRAHKKALFSNKKLALRDRIAYITLLINKKLFKLSWKLYCKVKY